MPVNLQRVGGSGSDANDVTTSLRIPTGKTLTFETPSEGFAAADLSGATTQAALATLAQIRGTYYATDFGLLPDGQEFRTASMTSGSASLTIVGATLTNADVGKLALVFGVGSAGAVLSSSILAVNSATNCTLADNAGTTGSGKIAIFGTDNRAILQEVIDALPDAGGIVQLPAGLICISGTIYLNRAYQTLQGVGPGTRSQRFDDEDPGSVTGEGSKLVCTIAAEAVHVTPPQDSDRKDRLGGITLRDFGVVGTSITNGFYGIKSEKLLGNLDLYGSTDDLIMERVAITRYQGGIVSVRNDITKIIDCWPTECGQGIEVSEGFYVQITNTCIADNPGFGIKLAGVLGGAIVGNIIVRNGADSIWITNGTRDVTFDGNVVRNDTGNPAITVFAGLLKMESGAVRNTFSGNTFTALAGTGFSINSGAIGNIFSANQLDNFTPDYGTGKNWVEGWESVWTAPTFLNSWVNFGSGLEVAAYRRSRTGRVQIQGTVKSGTVSNSTPVFNLPAGYRPNNLQLVGTITNDGVNDILGRLAIATTGDVRIETGGNTFASLNIEFSIPGFTA